MPLAAAVLLVGVLAWPLLFSHSYFTAQWLFELWYMWHQSLAIHADHVPSLFLSSRDGVLYPLYAFYGGTLCALAGALALALGNAPIGAYVITYLLGFAAAYGGWYWMARMAGLGRWWAQVPGLVFITSPYYLTLIYGRGDWPEFSGVSMIPLMVASGLSVLRAERLRAWPALALVGSTIVFFGSHNLTIVWGSTLLALGGLAILICVPSMRRQLTRAGAIRVIGLVVPALLVNAWYLLPDIAYESSTRIASEYPLWRQLLPGWMDLVSAQHLFTLSRASASLSDPAFVLSLPILAMAWALVSCGMLLRQGMRGAWARILLIYSILTVAVAVLMTHAGLILALPRAYATLQFSYRLESYLLLSLSGAILAALALGRSGNRWVGLWRWTLIPVLIVAIGGGIQQADAHPQTADRSKVFNAWKAPGVPNAEAVQADYVDIDLPPLSEPHEGSPAIDFTPSVVQDDRISATVRSVPGQLAYTNLQGAPSLVQVTGARIAGIDKAGYDVLEIGPHAHSARGTSGRSETALSTVQISLRPADSPPVVLGRVLTLAAAVALLLQLVALAVRSRRAKA